MLETANPKQTEPHFIYIIFNRRRNLKKKILRGFQDVRVIETGTSEREFVPKEQKA